MSDAPVKQMTLLDDETEIPAPAETPEFSDDSSTTIDLGTSSDDDLEIEILEEGAAAPAAEPEKAKAAEPAAPSVEELEEKTDKGNAQKRIDELTYKYREAERQRDKAIGVAQNLIKRTKELETAGKSSNVAHYKALQTAINERETAARTALRSALDEADNEKIATAQETLAEVKAQKMMLQSRAPREPAAATETTAAPTETTTAAAPAQTGRMSPETVNWLKTNGEWFEQTGNETLTEYAYGVSADLVRRGVKEGTAEYFTQIDARLRATFPDKFKTMTSSQTAETDTPGQGAKPATSSRPPVGGVRSPGANGSPRKVSLTSSQVQVAKGLGLTPKQYAEQLLKEQA